MDEYKEVNQKEKLAVKVEKAELKLQRDTLQQEIRCINEDYRAQYERKQEINRDMQEFQDAINDINEDM